MNRTSSDSSTPTLSAPSKPALLLIEFVTTERWVFPSRLFPYIKGCAEELGLDARWLCFGADIWTEKTSASSFSQYMPLDEMETEVLRRHINELRPTHIAISHMVSPAVLDLLTGGERPVSLLHLGDVASLTPGDLWELFSPTGPGASNDERGKPELFDYYSHELHRGMSRTDWIVNWLGRADQGGKRLQGRYLVGSVTPSYDAVMANERAKSYRPHLLIIGGLACDYRSPVGKNRFFEGIDLKGCDQDFGCAYCSWYRGPSSDLKLDPVEAACAQLRRVLETAGLDGRYTGHVDLLDVRILRHLERFTQAILELGMPPTRFYFEPRADRVLEILPILEKVLPRLASAGHSICFFRMGAENLVEEENERFNKGITLEIIDGTMGPLARLARQYPGTLDYDPTWGYITCSPWTTLESFELGVTRAMEREFEPLGVWLYTPLILGAGSPITRLARKEGGILCEQWEDIAWLYEAAANSMSVSLLLPWRFKDARMTVAFSLTVRFCAAGLRSKYPDTIFQDDVLYGQLLAFTALEDRYERPDVFALQVIDVVRKRTPPFDWAGILDKALRRYLAEISSRPELSREPTQVHHDASPTAASTVRVEKIRFLLAELAKRFPQLFGTINVSEVKERVTTSQPGLPPGREICLRLEVQGVSCEFTLADPKGGTRYFFRTQNLAVSHVHDLPSAVLVNRKRIEALVQLIDRTLFTYAPDTLPRS